MYNVYEIDLFRLVIDIVVRVVVCVYDVGNYEDDVWYCIIVDYSCIVVILIGDGVSFGNDGCGYVLCWLLCWVICFVKLLGIDVVIVGDLMVMVCNVMGLLYFEFVVDFEWISWIVVVEEMVFNCMLVLGFRLFEEVVSFIKKFGVIVLFGLDVFMLYDIYGFLIEFMLEMVVEIGL